VPYIKSIQKPNDSMIHNLDQNMTDVISNSKMSDDTKMKVYHQNLNRFLLKYDPDTYGVTPTLAKLAQIVIDFIDKKKDTITPNIKQAFQDLTSIKEESKINLKNFLDDENEENKVNLKSFDENEKSSDDDLDETYNKSMHLNLSNTSNKHDLTGYETFSTPSKIAYLNGDKHMSPIKKVKFSPITETRLDNYEKNIAPSKNTRLQKKPTHEEGLDSKRPIKITKSSKISSDKTKIIKTPKSIEQQKGNGLWLTKKFF